MNNVVERKRSPRNWTESRIKTNILMKKYKLEKFPYDYFIYSCLVFYDGNLPGNILFAKVYYCNQTFWGDSVNGWICTLPWNSYCFNSEQLVVIIEVSASSFWVSLALGSHLMKRLNLCKNIQKWGSGQDNAWWFDTTTLATIHSRDWTVGTWQVVYGLPQHDRLPPSVIPSKLLNLNDSLASCRQP